MKEKIRLTIMKMDRELLKELLTELGRKEKVILELDYFTALKEAMI